MRCATDSMKIVGMDPSLRHWGIAIGKYDLSYHELTITDAKVIEPVLVKSKGIRQNSLDLESATQLFAQAKTALEGAHAVFVEVPVGSQSARAMASYAICLGVLGALRASGKHFLQLAPQEIKTVAGSATATKKDMINWATNKHPEAPWPTHGKKISEAKAEHIADSIAAIYAGINSTHFQQMLQIRA